VVFEKSEQKVGWCKRKNWVRAIPKEPLLLTD
jgi:hypothetical protein